MKPEATEESRRWLLQAKQDLDDARYNSEGERYNIACFLSQQSAEKALKAFLYTEGGEMIWGHSVAELCKRATSVDKELEKVRRKAATLDKYYIPTRYPNGLPGGIPSRHLRKEMLIGQLRLRKK